MGIKVTSYYKGYKIEVDWYGYPHKKCYSIYDPSGKKIVDTLWNDDKMWDSDKNAIESAKRDIDNPEEGYIKLFNIK